VKDAATVLALGQHLKQTGIFASAVRPPTVPTSRLRVTVMAPHTQEDTDQLVEGIQEFWLQREGERGRGGEGEEK
ncbi:MAG: aminotransferase class I/II-fold pyridoxal phosphate-dependent enzyme, partial [Cyanobacteria bacterium P01_F01_bin.116]